MMQAASRIEPPMEAHEIVTVGKINFIVSECFSESGQQIDELMERLIVKKCRENS